MPISKALRVGKFIITSEDIAPGAVTFADIGTIYSSNITENSNLFFSNARATAAVEASLLANLNIAGNLVVDSNVLYIDSVSNRVGVGTTAPTRLFTVQTDNPSGSATLGVRNQSSGTGAYATITTEALGITGYFYTFGSGYTSSGQYLANSSLIEINGTNGLGLSAVSANTNASIRFYTNSGTERAAITSTGNLNYDSGTFFIDAAGNRVGIGTTSPSVTLDVRGNVSINPNTASVPAGWTGSYDGLTIISNKTAAIGDGRVGETTALLLMGVGSDVGNNSEVSIDFAVVDSNSVLGNIPQVRIGYSGATNPLVNTSPDNEAEGYFRIATRTATAAGILVDRYVVDGNGNTNIGSGSLYINAVNNRVGIGTTSPSVKLHVAGSSIIANNTSINPDSYTNQTVAGGISFTSGWGVSSAIGGNAGTGDSWAIGHNGSNLYFGMEDGSAADSMQTYMRFAPDRNLFLVESSGSVCIGTSTYSGSKMEVVGGTGIYRVLKLRSGESTAANNAGIEFYTTSGATASNRSMEMVLDADGANSSGMDYFIIRKRGNSGDAELWQVSNANLLFSTNDIERVRISNNGYVGIGTTLPKAYLHSKAGVIAFNGMGSNTSVTYDNYWTAFASSGAAGIFSGVLTITIPDVNGGTNNYGYGSWSAEVYLSGYSGVFCHWYISGYNNNGIQIAENAFRNSSGGFSGSWALNGAQGITLTLDYPSITHPTVYLRINKGGDNSGGIWTDFSAIRITWS